MHRICKYYPQIHTARGCYGCAGGAATGLAFGLACTFWLRFMYKHLLGEITLSVVCAYSCYLVADSLFGTSGVLAVVTLGGLLAAYYGVHAVSAQALASAIRASGNDCT